MEKRILRDLVSSFFVSVYIKPHARVIKNAGFFISMLSLNQARKIEPSLRNLSDEEVLVIIKSQYNLVQLAYEKWSKEKVGSKNP